MAIFDYKGLSDNNVIALMETTQKLAIHGNISGLLGLPSETYIQKLGDVLSNDYYANKIDVTLPDGWQETTPTQLGMPADTLDSWGFIPMESPLTGFTETGPQLKVLEHRNEQGEIDQLSVVFAGTNSPVDVVDYFQINENTIAPNMEPILEKVKDYAIANGLSGEDVLITGYSLGGGMTNVMAKNRADLAGGFFKDAYYVGHESPYIFDDGEVVFNVGYENDVVHRVIGDEASVQDAIDASKPGLINPDSYFTSSTDNLVLFDDVYASPLWSISPFTLLNIPFGWSAHLSGLLTDAVGRIGESSFYEFTHQDSTVIVDGLSALKRWNTWVGDKESPSSDHFDNPSFVIGTEHDDLLFGNAGGDYIDAGAGDDKIKVGAGADRVAGGEGVDTVMLEGSAADWTIYAGREGEYFAYDLNGEGLKQLEGVEKVKFMDAQIGQLHAYDLDDIAVADDVYGTEYNDKLSGEVLFGGKGNDQLTANYVEHALLHGGEGNDLLVTHANTASLYGAEGDDVLLVAHGNTLLSGGVGDDDFIFANAQGFNTITDFNAYAGDNDHIFIAKTSFTGDVADYLWQDGGDVHLDYDDFSLTINNASLDAVYSAIEII